MRLIDADALKKTIRDMPNDYYGDLCIGDALHEINEAPTIDAVPVVRGEWINKYINKYGHPCHCCSLCGFKASYQDKNFCPNCGADNRGREERE